MACIQDEQVWRLKSDEHRDDIVYVASYQRKAQTLVGWLEETDDWCRENCKGRWSYSRNHYKFEDKADATLFSVFWDTPIVSIPDSHYV